ncbi:dimethylamine monooxygenase subunit DmmA family protein [Actinocorallia lasiicapitis]
MAIDRTSVPRWGTTAPGVDTGGRSYAVVSLGEAARAVAERWIGEITAPLWHAHADALDDGLLAAFRRELGRANVGWRLMLTGPEDEVQILRSAAVEAGALQCEIRAHATSAERQRVYCAHCRTVSPTGAGIGGVVRCRGSGLDLVVHHHSRRLAAYLGYRADVEEAP